MAKTTMSFGKKELSLWTSVSGSKVFSVSKCANISRACTPVSVRPAPIMSISELSTTDKALFRVSCTDATLGWYCQPWYCVPLYASFIKYLKDASFFVGYKDTYLMVLFFRLECNKMLIRISERLLYFYSPSPDRSGNPFY